VKYLSLAVLIIFACLRMSSWHERQEKLQADCSRFLTLHGGKQLITLEGVLEKNPYGRWRLISENVAEPVLLTINEEKANFLTGYKVQVKGLIRCNPILKNPGKLSDSFFQLPRPTFSISEKFGTVSIIGRYSWGHEKIAQRFDVWLESIFKNYPGLWAFEKAVWNGSTQDLPLKFTQFYLEGGLMQILALSGQHVIAMIFIFGFFHRCLFVFLSVFFASKYLSPLFRVSRRFLPLICCLILYVTSRGNAPVLRTLALSLTVLILKQRNLQVSTLQLVLSAVAVLVLLDPDLLHNPSFFLSVAATGFLVRVFHEENTAKGIWHYFSLSLVMPVLVLPLSAFFFSKVALFAPLNQVLLAWFWDLLIPIGFLLPLVSTPYLLGEGEKLWWIFCDAHQNWGKFSAAGYKTVIRPNHIELFVIEFCLLIIASKSLFVFFTTRTRISRIV
jgi:ComEC/Rec2-related protein